MSDRKKTSTRPMNAPPAIERPWAVPFSPKIDSGLRETATNNRPMSAPAAADAAEK